MPMAEVRRRCPDAIVVSPRFDHYQEISEQVMDVLADFSPCVEALSLDEAFIDMSGAEHFFGPPEHMGRLIKKAVYDATHLNISVGISGTKYVAKVASAHNKPDGLTVVPPKTAKEWLAPLPVERLWGVGPKTAPRMHAIGIRTIGQIAASDLSYLTHHLGSAGNHFYQLAHAQDPRRVNRGRVAKSLGSDRTLNEDVSNREDIERHLSRSAERIARRIRKKNYVAGGIRIRLKTTKFEMLSRQRKFHRAADTASEFMKLARQLLDEFDHTGPFRLVGMAAFDLSWRSDPLQLDIFEDGQNRKLECTIDALAEKYGREVVFHGRDLSSPGTVASNGVNLDFLDYRDGERVSRPE